MSGNTVQLALMLVMAAINVGGTLALRLSNEPNKQLFFAIGTAAYVVGAVIFVALLRHQNLATMAVASSTLQLGLMVSLSIWLFGERVNLLQGSALAVAVLCSAIAMLVATN